MPSEPADAEAVLYWADAVLGDTELDIHEEPCREFADVYLHDDGTATLDEGWGAAFIESDELVSLEDRR